MTEEIDWVRSRSQYAMITDADYQRLRLQLDLDRLRSDLTLLLGPDDRALDYLKDIENRVRDKVPAPAG